MGLIGVAPTATISRYGEIVPRGSWTPLVDWLRTRAPTLVGVGVVLVDYGRIHDSLDVHANPSHTAGAFSRSSESNPPPSVIAELERVRACARHWSATLGVVSATMNPPVKSRMTTAAAASLRTRDPGFPSIFRTSSIVDNSPAGASQTELPSFGSSVSANRLFVSHPSMSLGVPLGLRDVLSVGRSCCRLQNPACARIERRRSANVLERFGTSVREGGRWSAPPNVDDHRKQRAGFFCAMGG